MGGHFLGELTLAEGLAESARWGQCPEGDQHSRGLERTTSGERYGGSLGWARK